MKDFTAELQAVFSRQVKEIVAIFLNILIEDLRVVIRCPYRDGAEGDGLRGIDWEVLPLKVAEVYVQIVDRFGVDGAVPVSEYGVVFARGIVGGTWICRARSQGVVVLEGEAVDASEDVILAGGQEVDAAEVFVDRDCLRKDEVGGAAWKEWRVGDATGLMFSFIGAEIPKLFPANRAA